MTLPFKDPRLKCKRIIVWENGDYFGDGHILGINSDHFRTWSGILAMVTQALKPSFGEVKSLIETKSRIPLRSFDELEENGKYVAVGGTERFRMSKDGGCYLTPAEKQAANTYYKEKARAAVARPKKKNIFVMANGRTQTLPCKVVFGEQEIAYWHSLLAIIAETLDIPQGIQCLYDVYGNATPDPRTLGNGCIYVAVAPNETFASINYVGAFQNLLPLREIDMVKIEGIFESQPNSYNPRGASKMSMPRGASKTSGPWGASKTSMGSSRMKLAGGRMPNQNIPGVVTNGTQKRESPISSSTLSLPISLQSGLSSVSESEETASLTNSELQRLVLLEQLNLIRVQKEKERVILEKLQNENGSLIIEENDECCGN